ncbi:MAG: hypothetical protein MJE77_20390 [Proteobacteria bacterium]|nr:hypothetical protein [Pseudomonadota bacterium]
MAGKTVSERDPNLAIALWGVFGFSFILVRAVWGLFPLAVEPIQTGSLSGLHIAAYVLWVAFMAYSEGYRGFQKHMSPRVAARAMYAARNPRPLLVILAPLFCMGLFHATRRRLAISWIILIGVIILIIAVRELTQPWRGIVDGGVVIGLGWGLLATLYYSALALTGRLSDVAAEVPEEAH